MLRFLLTLYLFGPRECIAPPPPQNAGIKPQTAVQAKKSSRGCIGPSPQQNEEISSQTGQGKKTSVEEEEKEEEERKKQAEYYIDVRKKIENGGRKFEQQVTQNKIRHGDRTDMYTYRPDYTYGLTVYYKAGPFSPRFYDKMWMEKKNVRKVHDAYTLCVVGNALKKCEMKDITALTAKDAGYRVALVLGASGQLRITRKGDFFITHLSIAVRTDCIVKMPRLCHNRGHVNIKCPADQGVRVQTKVDGTPPLENVLLVAWVGVFTSNDIKFDPEFAFLVDSGVLDYDPEFLRSSPYLTLKYESGVWVVKVFMTRPMKPTADPRTRFLKDGFPFSTASWTKFNDRYWCTKLPKSSKALCIMKDSKSVKYMSQDFTERTEVSFRFAKRMKTDEEEKKYILALSW